MKPYLFSLIFSLISTLNALEQPEKINEKWKEFQKKHEKSYKSVREINQRFRNFANNLHKYEKHNELYEKGLVSYKKGINKFTDWSEDEFMEYIRGSFIQPPNYSSVRSVSYSNVVVNQEKFNLSSSYVDWRSKGAVTRVKDEGNCGACWAFSTTGSLEGQLKIVRNKLIPLSEQMLVDCSYPQGYDSCTGGVMSKALDYIQSWGIESENDYPYVQRMSNCNYNRTKIVTRIQKYVSIERGSEVELQEAIATIGPISVGFDATFELQGYDSGILDDPFCTTYVMTHGLLVVGFGTENGLDYYIVKNSWGESWGENGYFRTVRNKGNRCGIASMASYPIL